MLSFDRVGTRLVAMTGKWLFLCTFPFRTLYKDQLFSHSLLPHPAKDREPCTSSFGIPCSVFNIGFSQPLPCSGYFTSNKSSPTKLTSPRPGGPGKTTVTSFLPFPALAGICSVPRILVRDVRDNPVRSISPMLTLEGRICTGGNGGCALPFNVTVTVNCFPTKPLPGVTRTTPSPPPPGWPPPPPGWPPPPAALGVPWYLARKYGNSAVTK